MSERAQGAVAPVLGEHAPETWRDNPQWKAETPAGVLDVTINIRKPEKDPRDIAAAACKAGGAAGARGGEAVSEQGGAEATAAATGSCASGRPTATCDLCWEPATPDAPAHLCRSGQPVGLVKLQGEPWAWWYSPYGYFPEHLIVAAAEHRSMAINRATVECLLDFVDAHPAYFIGSNADLPIVGGSILGHDHFQGGRYRFPLMDAPLERAFRLEAFPAVQAGIVRWPAATVRLRAQDRRALTDAAARIMTVWRGYSDEACGIWAATDARGRHVAVKGESAASSEGFGRGSAGGAAAVTLHNTLNPILWREGDDYVLDLVLRNNRTTPERPFGLFHPDESLFHIKKENIGLIEIMGRAILPGRLAQELPGVKDEASQGFYQVLCATGVFKQNEADRAGWDRFLAALDAAG